MTDHMPVGDLRERLAEALYRRLREQVGSDAGAQIRAEAKAADLVDAVLPVVEAETAALRQRAEEAERQRDTAREALAGAGIVIASLRDQRDEVLAAVQRVRTLGQSLADGLDPDGHDDDAAEVGSRILRTLDHSKESSR